MPPIRNTAAYRPDANPQDKSTWLGKEKSPRVFRLGGFLRSAQGGIRTRYGGMENLRQDAPLPSIPLILLGFVVPPCTTLCHLVPPESALVRHTDGTCEFPSLRGPWLLAPTREYPHFGGHFRAAAM